MRERQPLRITEKPNYFVFDIETISVPAEMLDGMMPKEIKEPMMPRALERPEIPHFHNGTLAKGKGPEAEAKHDAWKSDKLAQFHAEHKAKIDKWQMETLDARLKWIESACLRAETANVPLVCVREPSGAIAVFVIAELSELDMPRISAINPVAIIPAASEKDLLLNFWAYVRRVLADDISARFTGWNSNKFDLPMLQRRSWINRVMRGVSTYAGFYADGSIWADLMELWQCGDRHLYAGAEAVAQALGVRGKTDHGGNFGAKWKDSKTEAIIYCMNDVLCEAEICDVLTLP